MHLKRLEKAGLVTSQMELSEDGKAMNYYELVPFNLELTPQSIMEACRTLTVKNTDHKARATKKEVKEDE